MTVRKTVCIAVALALAGCAHDEPDAEAERERARRVERSGAGGRRGRVRRLVEHVRLGRAAGSSSSEALAGSPDLAIAMERVRQAEAQVRIAGASLFPTLDLGVGTSARSTSDSRGSTTTEASSATLQRELRARPVGPQPLRRALGRIVARARPRSTAIPRG